MNTRDPLRDLAPPAVPHGLRARVLSAARRAAHEAAPRRHWVDVLWESRVIRRAWTGAVVVLLAVYAWLSPSSAPGSARAAREGEQALVTRLPIGSGVIGALGATRPSVRLPDAWGAFRSNGAS